MTQEKREILNEIMNLLGEDLEKALEALKADDIESVRENIEMALCGLDALDRQVNFYN